MLSTQKIPFYSFLFLSIFFLSILSSCDKEGKKVIAPPEVKASAVINGAFTTLTDTDLEISFQDGQVINRITLSRLGGLRIVLTLPGTTKTSFVLLQGNAIPNARLIDQLNRNYVCKNGKATISDYYNRDGLYRISGTFEFDGEYTINDTTKIELKVRNGGFVNVEN
jgi:hypothetical protein